MAWAELVSNEELDRFVMVTSSDKLLTFTVGDDLSKVLNWKAGERFHLTVDLDAKPPAVKLSPKDDAGWLLEKAPKSGLALKARQLASKAPITRKRCSAALDGKELKVLLPDDFAIKDQSMVRKNKA